MLFTVQIFRPFSNVLTVLKDFVAGFLVPIGFRNIRVHPAHHAIDLDALRLFATGRDRAFAVLLELVLIALFQLRNGGIRRFRRFTLLLGEPLIDSACGFVPALHHSCQAIF